MYSYPPIMKPGIRCSFFPDILNGAKNHPLESILPDKVEDVISKLSDNLSKETDENRKLMAEHIEFLKPHIGKRVHYEYGDENKLKQYAESVAKIMNDDLNSKIMGMCDK